MKIVSGMLMNLDGRYGKITTVIVEEGAEGNMIGTPFRDHFTVVGAICANGQHAPPMWIAKGKAPIAPDAAVAMLAGTIPGSGLVNTVKGWIDHSTWTIWLQFWLAHLRVRPTAERPVLLILDSHSSRFTWQAIQYAMDQHVLIYALLPKTTAFAKPLDVLIFGSFKVRVRGPH
jgi:DDE superfamily endonuclease